MIFFGEESQRKVLKVFMIDTILWFISLGYKPVDCILSANLIFKLTRLV